MHRALRRFSTQFAFNIDIVTAYVIEILPDLYLQDRLFVST